MKNYSFLTHTADIGMNVRGKTLKNLFSYAAHALFAYLKTSTNKNRPFCLSIKISGVDYESLLVNWLNELNYLSAKKKVYLHSFVIKRLSRKRLEAKTSGFGYRDGNNPSHEIKAATYHNLKIRKTKTGFMAQIIFDI
jgi:SHS2 domain-containing protein